MKMKSENISIICLGVPLLFYLGQAAYYAVQQGRYGMCIAFAAYAVANVGFILDTKGF